MTIFKLKVKRPRPVVLCILDGWGLRGPAPGNAIELARTPVYHRMMRECPHTHIATSGLAVGLPEGQMGNSEVGHMNIGAGRVVMQDLPRIDLAVADGSLAKNAELAKVIRAASAGTKTVHLMGLMSPGGVHSHQDQIAALAKILAGSGLKVQVHAFLDGRDTPPNSALGFVEQFENAIAGVGGVAIASVGGRYFAMDRDKRWDRVAKAWAQLVDGDAPAFPSAKTAIEAAYAEGQSDEFVTPRVVGKYAGMKDGDAVLMANFRADRARQIMTALTDPKFDGFARRRLPKLSIVAGLTEYSDALTARMTALFASEQINNGLGATMAKLGLRQLRIAETEKYAHVTFFFNGGQETVFEGEDRILVPSPKVATYDLKPEMAALEVTDRLTEAIGSGKYDLIVANYANPDMVGHTGDLSAAIEAVETIDACLGRLWHAAKESGGVILLTADHGNIEMMIDPETGERHTAHTTLDVPAAILNAGVLGEAVRLKPGRLADIAPTILAIMGLEQPHEMTGTVLIERGAQVQVTDAERVA